MLNKFTGSISYYFLLMSTFLYHLLIPLLCFVAIVVLYRKHIIHNTATKVISILLVCFTFCSYFVGVYCESKVNCNCESLSMPSQDDYFYIESEDNTFSYNGKIFVLNKNESPKNYMELFSDKSLSDIGLSSIGKSVLDNHIGFKSESTDTCSITYSPLVLCENNFLYGRNNYAGYIVIENSGNQDSIVVIAYQLNFKETVLNNLTFTEVYSNKYAIHINDILNSIVTEEQYFINIYS